MNKKPQPFDIVSSGTLRDSDLLDAMLRVLECYRPVKYKDLIAKGREFLEVYPDFGYISYFYEVDKLYPFLIVDELIYPLIDELDWLINEDLFNAMQDVAPSGCYYGSNPGDASLLGFWPPDESPLWM